MEKVNVIEFIQTVGDGGAETLVKDYALLMNKERFQVTVVVLHDVADSANLRHLRSHGIPVIALSSQEDVLKKAWHKLFWRKQAAQIQSEHVLEKPVLPGDTYEQETTLRRVRNYARNLYFGLKFLKVQRQLGASVVHAHLDLLECLQTVAPALKGVRLFHTCHALPHLIYAGVEGRAARYLIDHNGLQLIALHSDMAKEMDTMFPGQKTVVIRNGVDFHRFQHPQTTGDGKRAELGIPEKAFVVGHVGRFTPEKNHGFLVDVFREIAKREPNAYLLMIGAGDHRDTEDKLKEYGLADRYQILSGRADIPELLAAMDVFVFPSIFEGFPVSVIEAQAAGLRCIVSDRCPAEVIRMETCIPMPFGNPEDWAQAALDRDRKREASKPLSDYDMNREIRRLERLYLGQRDET